MARKKIEPVDDRIHLIPISKIYVGPNNPRKAYFQWMVDGLALSMGEPLGQIRPILVNLLSPEKKAEIAKSMGLTECPYEYELLGGFLRKLAAEKLGWSELKGLVYDVGPVEALELAYTDNVSQKVDWFGQFLTIESVLSLNITQADIAKQFQTSEKDVSHVKKVMGLLNDSARSKILSTRKAFGASKEPYKISKNLAVNLADLHDGSENKSKAQELMDRALTVVLDRKMAAPKASQLAAWIKAGNPPESFPKTDKKNDFDPTDPYSDYWKVFPPDTIKVTNRNKDYRIRLTLPSSMVAPVAYAAMSEVESIKGLAKGSEDLQYSKSLPALREAGVRAWAAEEAERQSLEAHRQQEADEEEKRRAKEAADKQAAKDAKKQAKLKAREEKGRAKAEKRLAATRDLEAERSEAVADLEAHQLGLKQSLQAYWGPGFVADDLMEYLKEGNSTQALKLAKNSLAGSRKPKEEQQAFLAGFEKALERQGNLMKRAGIRVRAGRKHAPVTATVPSGQEGAIRGTLNPPSEAQGSLDEPPPAPPPDSVPDLQELFTKTMTVLNDAMTKRKTQEPAQTQEPPKE